MGVKQALSSIPNVEILFEEPMSKHTTYRLGGKASYFIKPFSVKALKDTVRILCEYSIPYFVIGNGSNLLVSDKGFCGAVISSEKLNGYIFNDNFVTATCGANLNSVIISAKERGLTGLENLYGIPSLIGGAVYMNAGAFSSQICDNLKVVCTLSNGKLKYYDKEDCKFSYRSSIFQKNGEIILSASFTLQSSPKNEISNRIKEIINERKRLPVGKTCGCVFRNPKGLSAGKLIDGLGLKGFSSGGAYISQEHANFIVAKKGAKAKDVYNLINYVKKKVKEAYSVNLIEEVKLIGEF